MTSAPSIDDYDVLHFERRWIALGSIEAKIARVLIGRPGEVVTRAALEAAGWGGQLVKANTVDRQVYRLRSHLAALGLSLHTIRGHGYLLELPAHDTVNA